MITFRQYTLYFVEGALYSLSHEHKQLYEIGYPHSIDKETKNQKG